MIELPISDVSKPVVLCLGAHCDDIEIGCGGTLLEWGDRLKDAELHCIVFSSNKVREVETRNALSELAKDWGSVTVDVHDFRNGFFPYIGDSIKDFFESLKADIAPDLIFTHYREDRHQDHRVISDLTSNTFRDHLILEYEIPKYDGDLGRPNAYFEISEANADKKVDCLQKHFVSQHDKRWFKPENFKALMRLRSIECNAESGFAEAFYARKMKLR